MDSPSNCDILVVGGGPAGSTISTLLRRRGYDVVVLEKDHHPRFHIGESLLPANLPLFRDLGVEGEIAAIAMPKWGVEFVSPWHDHASRLEFADAWSKEMPYAYQVRRADFDHILIENARRAGVRVFEGCRAGAVEFLPDGAGVRVSATGGDAPSQWQARYLVDASGRDTLLANRFACKRKNPRHNSAALFAHFEGVERLPGKLEGNITIFWFEHGWFWLIPLTDGVTSIGAVCWPSYLRTRTKSVEEFFQDTIRMCPALCERLRQARVVSPVHATGNYSYTADRSHGENFLMVGDAYAFVDPVFSSGVYLAMNSAYAGAEAIDTVLKNPASSASALAAFDRVMRKGPREFSWFIYRVTNPTMRNLFMAPRNVMRVKEAVLSLLAGDIFGRTPIWPSLYLFKAVYYASSIANLRRTWRAWLRRRENIRDQEPAST